MQSDGPAEREVVVASGSLCQSGVARPSPQAAFAKAISGRRLGHVFNLSGSELVFLVLIALVVLGPDKLPEAMRRAGKAYNDFKKMTSGFQSEMRTVLDEPMRELRETANLVKQSAMFDSNAQETPSQDITPRVAPTLGATAATATATAAAVGPSAPAVESGVETVVEPAVEPDVEQELDPAAAQAALPAFTSTIVRPAGPNFTSAAPTPTGDQETPA